jgi:hypothetical protein
MSKEEIERLQSHSEMLRLIASHTSPFCLDETDTTLMAVLRLLRDYHFAKAEVADLYLDKEEEK